MYTWYLWLLVPGFVIGIVTVSVVIISLFASWGRRAQQFALRGNVALCDDDFYRTLSAHSGAPLQKGGRPIVLENGDEIFPAMFDAIRAAKHSVHIMVFIWNDGALSDAFLALLVERARAGVEVRLLIDSLGGIRAPDAKFIGLQAAGGVVEWYRRIEFGKLTRFHKRNHRRAIVIDGTVAFTGGISVSDEWLGNADSPAHWRDMMFQVSGILAQRLQDAFAQSWHAATGEILAGAAYFPPYVPETDVRFVSMVSSPSDDVHPIRTLFWLSLAVAERSIVIANAYFVPDEIIRSILIEKSRAGVDVRILVPSMHTDMPPVQWAGRYYYEPLLAAGVQIAEYQPTMLHSKFIVIDDVWSIIGSANVDVRSKELNEENVFAIEDEQLARELTTSFRADWTEGKVMTSDAWRQRGAWWKLKESLAALFTEQF